MPHSDNKLATSIRDVKSTRVFLLFWWQVLRLASGKHEVEACLVKKSTNFGKYYTITANYIKMYKNGRSSTSIKAI